MAEALADLDDDPANARAWRLFNRIATRFTVQCHLAAEAFTVMTADLPADDRPDLLDRLSLIYGVLYPEPEQKD